MLVGAVQTRLADTNLRCDANIVVETATARDPHQFAVLLGFGATAVYPYLAYEALGKMLDDGSLDKDYRTAMQNYQNGINKGLYKIMSKTFCFSCFSTKGTEDRQTVKLTPHYRATALLLERNGVARGVIY